MQPVDEDPFGVDLDACLSLLGEDGQDHGLLDFLGGQEDKRVENGAATRDEPAVIAEPPSRSAGELGAAAGRESFPLSSDPHLRTSTPAGPSGRPADAIGLSIFDVLERVPFWSDTKLRLQTARDTRACAAAANGRPHLAQVLASHSLRSGNLSNDDLSFLCHAWGASHLLPSRGIKRPREEVNGGAHAAPLPPPVARQQQWPPHQQMGQGQQQQVPLPLPMPQQMLMPQQQLQHDPRQYPLQPPGPSQPVAGQHLQQLQLHPVHQRMLQQQRMQLGQYPLQFQQQSQQHVQQLVPQQAQQQQQHQPQSREPATPRPAQFETPPAGSGSVEGSPSRNSSNSNGGSRGTPPPPLPPLPARAAAPPERRTLTLSPNASPAGSPVLDTLMREAMPRLQTLSERILELHTSAPGTCNPLIARYGSDFLTKQTSKAMWRCAQLCELLASRLETLGMATSMRLIRAEILNPATGSVVSLGALTEADVEAETLAQKVYLSVMQARDELMRQKSLRPPGWAVSPAQQAWEDRNVVILLAFVELLKLAMQTLALARADAAAPDASTYLKMLTAVLDFLKDFNSRLIGANVIRANWVDSAIAQRAKAAAAQAQSQAASGKAPALQPMQPPMKLQHLQHTPSQLQQLQQMKPTQQMQQQMAPPLLPLQAGSPTKGLPPQGSGAAGGLQPFPPASLQAAQGLPTSGPAQQQAWAQAPHSLPPLGMPPASAAAMPPPGAGGFAVPQAKDIVADALLSMCDAISATVGVAPARAQPAAAAAPK